MSKLGLTLRLLAHRLSGATLHDVVMNGDVLLLRELLSKGIHKPNEIDPKDERRSKTALYLAVCFAHLACAVELLKFGAVPVGEHCPLLFKAAIERGNLAFLPLLSYYGATHYSRTEGCNITPLFIDLQGLSGMTFENTQSIHEFFSPARMQQFREDLPRLRKQQEEAKQAYKASEITTISGCTLYKKETLMQALQRDIDAARHLYDIVKYEETLHAKYRESKRICYEPARALYIQMTNEALAYFSKEVLQIYARLIRYFELLPSEGEPLLVFSSIRLDDSGDKEPSDLTLTQEILLAREKELRPYLDKSDEECQQIMQAFDQLRYRISAQALCARRAREDSGSGTESVPSSTTEAVEMTTFESKLKME